MKFVIKLGNMLPHQQKWWAKENFIKLLVGGYGSGKTYIGAMRAIYLSYINAGIPGMYVSPTYKLAKKTIIPTIKDIANRAGLRLTHNKTDAEFHIENWGGHFWIGSGDDPDSLRGPNLAWAGIDEPFIQSIDVFEQMMARVRHPQATHREMFLTGTPEELNWGYDIAMNDAGKYDIGVVVGRTADNTHLPPEYVETLTSAYTEEMREAYLEGKFVNLTRGRAYKPFSRDAHVKHMDCTGLQICAGVDFNVDYMTAEVFYNGNGWVHFFDEIRLANSNTFELADKLARKYPGIRIYPDATGAMRKSSSTKSDHQILRDAGFILLANRANPRVMDRVNAVNKLLMHGHMTIEPGTCQHLITDLDRNVFKNGDIDKQSDISLTHAGDAAGYGISYLYPVQRREAFTGVRT